MNKWSTSLPSIFSLSNDVEFNFDPTFIQQSTTPTPSVTSSVNRNLQSTGGSLTDLSILIQAQPSFINYDRYSNNYSQSRKQTASFYDTSIEHETTIQADITTHAQFVPNDQLLQSLVAYADSFDLDCSVYSIQNTKPQGATGATTTITTTASISNGQIPLRRRTQSSTTHLTSMIDNDPLLRHKSCDDLSIICSVTSSSKPTTVVPRDEHINKKNSTKFVPSESHPQFFFAAKSSENEHLFDHNPKENVIQQGTTTAVAADRAKLEWEFSSNAMNELHKSSDELFNNYEATTNIGDINSNYLKDLERFSSIAASMDFSQEIPTPVPPKPVIIRKKSRDLLLKQQVDIQLLRPPTPPPPPPIIIREVRHKPPPSRKPLPIHHKLENNGQIHISKTPSPIILRERPPLPLRHEHMSKPTIVYHHLPTPPPSPPTVIVERLRTPNTPTVIRKPAPILVEKWLPYPPEQKRQVIYERASPLPTTNKHQNNEQPKKIIVEYDNVNVIVNKDFKQRQQIKRVSPHQYVKQYGNSLCSNETINQLLNNVTCSEQVRNEQTRLSNQYHYQNYSPMFH